MSYNIKIAGSEDDDRWDDFVAGHPKGSIYHLSAWRRVLQNTYHYLPLYLALERNASSDFGGVLPFMLVKSRLTGDRLVSLPFSSFCPPLVPDYLLPEMVRFNMTRHPGINYLELKSREAVRHVPDFLVQQSRYVTHLLSLEPGEEGVLRNSHATSVRQRIRRAQRNGVTLRFASTEEDLRHFYRLHVASRKKHGLPPHPLQFFRHMWRELTPRNLLFVPLLEYQGEVVSGAFALSFKDTVTLEYSATAESALHVGANQLLIWEVIRRGCAEGARYLDFGRSAVENKTLIEFKERWGGKRLSLSYYYYPDVEKVGVEGSLGRRLLYCANRVLPASLLKVEGALVYPHLG